MSRLLPLVLILLSFQQHFSQVSADTLRVGFTKAPPFIIQEDGLLEGINIWLWKQVADDLNLNYELVQLDFADMLDSLKQGKLDVSINPLTITGERSKEMEFTHSFFASHSTIAVAQKSSLQRVKHFFGAFFHINFLRGFLLLLIMLLFFGLITWLAEHKGNPEHFRPGWRGIWDGLWWSMVTLSTVGYGDKAPKTRMGKIAALGLMFSGLLFVSGLTASIASSLTVNQLANSTEDFSSFKKRRVGTVKRSEADAFLKSHFFRDVSLYKGVLPGLQDLSDHKIDGFIYDEPILQYRIRKDSSLNKVELLPMKFDVQFYAFGIKKDSVLLEQAISQRILEIIETQEWEVVLSEFGLTEL
ncbi:transporter substrate-binding domain-containing protein [Croceitalea rosinachiae]|uniref:Transporter substrate-binding domain-containing protein n=1 Tax=Croceitalea rosinachiae TaxID=3075596 RepID=A0ABU3ACP3_9FLAO|nr:transporter substrate-binding domain-containing protein [Croceitalea sp. F388]MDT0607683.1 transporter substrate-binding domain-containing protein [Croceitalea sp. F388]